MPKPFSFATATEILFGRGQASAAADRIGVMGERLLLVHGSNAARSEALFRTLSRNGCQVTRYSVRAEPDTAVIEAGVETARSAGVQAVIAMGGGAVIDAGKAIAALVPAIRPMLDHLEVVGQGLPLDCDPLPFVAMPTTAGTGAEVTRNAVIGVPEHRRKVSLRDARMLPCLAIIDPELTDHCPREITLASGLDAITQVIEPYICTRANPMTDALCRDAIPRGLAALKRLMEQEDTRARDDLAWVSLCGGLALANSGLGAVHGLAGPLGGLTGAAHGAICGVLLPQVLIANRAAVDDTKTGERMDEIGAWIGAVMGGKVFGLNEAASKLADWSHQNGLATLNGLGIDEAAQVEAASTAASSSSMKANPAPLSSKELREIMRRAN